MLTLRNEQFQELALDYHLREPAPFIAHLHQFHASRAAALGHDGLLEWTRAAIRKAHGHGLRSIRDICRYMDLAMIFGLDWSSPKLAWMQRALMDDAEPDPSRRLEGLRRRVMYKLDELGAAKA